MISSTSSHERQDVWSKEICSTEKVQPFACGTDTKKQNRKVLCTQKGAVRFARRQLALFLLLLLQRRAQMCQVSPRVRRVRSGERVFSVELRCRGQNNQVSPPVGQVRGGEGLGTGDNRRAEAPGLAKSGDEQFTFSDPETCPFGTLMARFRLSRRRGWITGPRAVRTRLESSICHLGPDFRTCWSEV